MFLTYHLLSLAVHHPLGIKSTWSPVQKRMRCSGYTYGSTRISQEGAAVHSKDHSSMTEHSYKIQHSIIYGLFTSLSARRVRGKIDIKHDRDDNFGDDRCAALGSYR